MCVRPVCACVCERKSECIRAFVHRWPLHGLIRRFRDVFVAFLLWSPAGTTLCSVLTCQSRCGLACMIQGWCVHDAGQPNLMKPNANLQKEKKKSCASVGYTSEDDVWTFFLSFFFFCCCFVCVSERHQSRQWGDGSERVKERKQCVPICPLRWGSNFTPWNPPCPPLHPCLTPRPPPPFPQAPSSLLEALEQHLASLEGRKLKDLSTASRYDHMT